MGNFRESPSNSLVLLSRGRMLLPPPCKQTMGGLIQSPEEFSFPCDLGGAHLVFFHRAVLSWEQVARGELCP